MFPDGRQRRFEDEDEHEDEDDGKADDTMSGEVEPIDGRGAWATRTASDEAAARSSGLI